ncbi:hypothetical protein PHYC_00895 [Phycisphaerales bacterium]|nr:hypothetical protein PHYC_00895 [Phycisphaerales bacterium]
MKTFKPGASLMTLVLLAGAASAQQAAPAPIAPPEALPPAVTLFHDDPAIAPPARVPDGLVQVKSVFLDAAGLRRLVPGQEVLLSPDAGPAESWYVDSVARPADNIRIVRCRHSTDPTGYAAFVTYDDATAMTLQVASRRATYRLQFAGNGQYHVWRIDPATLPPEGMPLAPPAEPPRQLDPSDDDYVPEGYGGRNPGGCNGGNRVLDILSVYTVEARDAIGGTSAMRAECALAVDHANTAYINSSMSTRMRLVYCNEIAYTESGDQNIDLPRLRDTADGFMDGVHTTRDNVNADIVQLVINSGSGLGYCPGGAPTYAGSPFSTGAWWRIAVTYTTAHETGHNLGGGHNVADGGACGPSYGVGWRFFGTDSNGYCTVIAYPTATYTRVLHYSNPSVNYQGTPTGVTIGLPNEAHNQRVLTDNDNTMEGFELTRYDIYVDFAYGGIEIGTASLPYNTVAEGVANIDTPNTGAGENPTLYIDAGTQAYHATISKAMTIIPCGGSVTIN